MFKKSLILGFVLLFLPLMVSAGVIFRTPTSLGLTSGLVGHWTFDGADIYGTSVRDKSGNGNHGTIAGSTKVIGKLGQALSFDGADDYVGGFGDLIGVGTITACSWFKTTYGGALFGNVRFRIVPSGSGQIIVTSDNGATNAASATGAYSLNDWTHVCAVRLNVETVSIYVNGVLSGSPDQSNTIAAAAGFTFVLGARGSALTNYYSGFLDDVRIYNRALSANEISRLYNMGASNKFKTPSSLGLSSGLVGHWTFDGNKISGTSALDSSVSNKTGVITGATKTIGKLGQGLNFDGSSDYVSVTNAITLVSPYSVSVWFYPRQLGSVLSRGLIAFNTGGQPFTFLDSTRIQIMASNTGTFRTWCNKTFTADDLNKWWHLTYIVNSTTNASLWKCYLNSTNVGVVDSDSSGTYKEPTTSWTLGAYYNNSYWFDGVLDDVRIYNRAISDSEIKELYNLGVATKINKSPTNSLTSGLVGYWTFDGADTYWSSATAGTVSDKSGNNNTGTMTNMSRSSSPTIGKIGQALGFDGVDEHVTTGSVLGLGNANVTIANWVYLYDTSESGAFVKIGQESPTNNGYALGVGNNNFDTDGNEFLMLYEGVRWIDTNITIGVGWHHVAMVIDSSGVPRGYIDGVPTGLFAGSVASITTGATKIGGYLGSGAENRFGNFKLDDVRVYSRALSATEIKQLYNAGR